MGNGPTRPHVTALAMYCTPDIVTVSLTPNTGHEPRPEAGARRTLKGGGSMPSLGWLLPPYQATEK
jgi:hypothetical protein